MAETTTGKDKIDSKIAESMQTMSWSISDLNSCPKGEVLNEPSSGSMPIDKEIKEEIKDKNCLTHFNCQEYPVNNEAWLVKKEETMEYDSKVEPPVHKTIEHLPNQSKDCHLKEEIGQCHTLRKGVLALLDQYDLASQATEETIQHIVNMLEDDVLPTHDELTMLLGLSSTPSKLDTITLSIQDVTSSDYTEKSIPWYSPSPSLMKEAVSENENSIDSFSSPNHSSVHITTSGNHIHTGNLSSTIIHPLDNLKHTVTGTTVNPLIEYNLKSIAKYVDKFNGELNIRREVQSVNLNEKTIGSLEFPVENMAAKTPLRPQNQKCNYMKKDDSDAHESEWEDTRKDSERVHNDGGKRSSSYIKCGSLLFNDKGLRFNETCYSVKNKQNESGDHGYCRTERVASTPSFINPSPNQSKMPEDLRAYTDLSSVQNNVPENHELKEPISSTTTQYGVHEIPQLRVFVNQFSNEAFVFRDTNVPVSVNPSRTRNTLPEISKCFDVIDSSRMKKNEFTKPAAEHSDQFIGELNKSCEVNNTAVSEESTNSALFEKEHPLEIVEKRSLRPRNMRVRYYKNDNSESDETEGFESEWSVSDSAESDESEREEFHLENIDTNKDSKNKRKKKIHYKRGTSSNSCKKIDYLIHSGKEFRNNETCYSGGKNQYKYENGVHVFKDHGYCRTERVAPTPSFINPSPNQSKMPEDLRAYTDLSSVQNSVPENHELGEPISSTTTQHGVREIPKLRVFVNQFSNEAFVFRDTNVPVSVNPSRTRNTMPEIAKCFDVIDSSRMKKK